MTHEDIINTIAEAVILFRLREYLEENYDRDSSSFFTNDKEPFGLNVPYTRLIPCTKDHTIRNGISTSEVDRWFKKRSNIYSLLSQISKATSLNVSLEEVEDWDIIDQRYGYSNFRRMTIKYVHFSQIRGMSYNDQKYITIGKTITSMLKNIFENRNIRFEMSRFKKKDQNEK